MCRVGKRAYTVGRGTDGLLIQTTMLSQSWRCPKPLDGESFGKYQLYMMAQTPRYQPERTYTWPGLWLQPPLDAPVGFKPLLGCPH